MRSSPGLIVLSLLLLTTLGQAGPTLYFDQLTRETDACGQVGSTIVYHVAGRRYELPAKDVHRIDGQCEDGAALANPSVEPDPLAAVLDTPSALPPTDAVLASQALVLPTLSWRPSAAEQQACGSQSLRVTVLRVVDGDTIEVRLPDGHREIVRYIGINTPELHHPQRGAEPGGLAARNVNVALLQGKQIELAFDVDARDRYGRLLAYAYADGTFVNAELVRRGYAATASFAPNVRCADIFRQFEREARGSSAGLWGESSLTRVAIAGASDIDLAPRSAEVSSGSGVSSGASYGSQVPGTSSGSSSNTGGSVSVRGYTRSDGTYVAPYTRSAPGSGSGRRR
jgi:endonuclease YncB( thermonuclease family)